MYISFPISLHLSLILFSPSSLFLSLSFFLHCRLLSYSVHHGNHHQTPPPGHELLDSSIGGHSANLSRSGRPPSHLTVKRGLPSGHNNAITGLCIIMPSKVRLADTFCLYSIVSELFFDISYPPFLSSLPPSLLFSLPPPRGKSYPQATSCLAPLISVVGSWGHLSTSATLPAWSIRPLYPTRQNCSQGILHNSLLYSQTPFFQFVLSCDCTIVVMGMPLFIRYPADDHPEFPLPESIPLFCLPSGVAVEHWDRHTPFPLPTFSTFALTNAQGQCVSHTTLRTLMLHPLMHYVNFDL